jgi:hypothetical protein
MRPGLQHAQQLRREEVHLPPEVLVVVGVAEVVVRRRVLVLVGERNRREDEANAALLHSAGLVDAVVVDDA